VLPTLIVLCFVSGAPDRLARAHALIDHLEFTKAIAEIEQQLLTELPLARRLEAYELLALAWSAKSDADEAKKAYVQLLRLDPGRAVDSSHSPKMRIAFEAARLEIETKRPAFTGVRISYDVGTIDVSGTLEDPLAMVAEIRIGAVSARVAKNNFDARVPRQDNLRELVVTAHAASGIELSRATEPLVALEVAVAPKVEEEDRIMPWWGWTIVAGVVAAGVGVGVYFAVRPTNVIGEVEPAQPF
jgi:hypothetical protein